MLEYRMNNTHYVQFFSFQGVQKGYIGNKWVKIDLALSCSKIKGLNFQQIFTKLKMGPKPTYLITVGL